MSIDEPENFVPKTDNIFFKKKQVISNMYKEAKVKTLNICLPDVLELTPTINLITLFLFLIFLVVQSSLTQTYIIYRGRKQPA
jgi:hypothetical protein